ncbi:MAG: UDP-glucose 4-epimerase GalE, partial [Desulfobacteraceae bacterium]
MDKILVVGGAGYIGSHMVKMLLGQGHEVIILDNFSTGYRRLVTGGELVEGRLGDTGLLERLFSENTISAVMHFAANSLVGESVQLPLKYYQNNVAETVALIDAMVRHNVMRFIFSSTAAVYGEPEEIPIVEEHQCNPTNPYGVSKLAVERILSDCDTAYGLKSICLRYFNAAGADASAAIGEMHDPETHLIPLVLKSAISGNSIKVFGTDYPTPDGTCLRDYVHVTDLAQAHLLALKALMDGANSTAYNLGNSVGYSVRQVIDLAGKVSGKNINIIEDSRRPGDPAVLVANADKIKRELDWQPKYEDLETIIETAWNWHHQK